MSIYAVTVQAYFDASHQVEGMVGCNGRHGHTWCVRATVVGEREVDENGVLRVAYLDTQPDWRLQSVANELDARDLNDMLPAVITTPEGVAAWFLERIPEADYVEVEMGWRKQTGRATRDKKRL